MFATLALVVAGGCVVLFWGISTARATTLRDVQVGLRTLEFISPPIRGTVDVAILHDARDAASRDDGRKISQWLADNRVGLSAGFLPHLLDTESLGTAQPFRVAVVAKMQPEHYKSVQSYSIRHKTITITADIPCVMAHACIVGVTTAQRTEIVISRQASQSCGITFLEAFRMMVTEY